MLTINRLGNINECHQFILIIIKKFLVRIIIIILVLVIFYLSCNNNNISDNNNNNVNSKNVNSKNNNGNHPNLCPNIEYKTVYLGDQNMTSYTTIVTTLFIFTINKKRSNSSYYEWSGRMIKSLGAPVVAYIGSSLEEVFTKRFKESNLTGNLII